jgi:hypothetical protein
VTRRVAARNSILKRDPVPAVRQISAAVPVISLAGIGNVDRDFLCVLLDLLRRCATDVYNGRVREEREEKSKYEAKRLHGLPLSIACGNGVNSR